MFVANKKKGEPYDIYIGRGSDWGNPFPMTRESDREYVITKHEVWLNTRPDLILRTSELKDKVLGCYCHPKPCHGDILVRQANSKYVLNWFSNMIPFGAPFVYQGIEFHSAENFYQAMKIPKERDDLRRVIAGLSPHKSKVEIKKMPIRADWSRDLALEVMEYILQYKFSLSYWRAKLDLTEDWEIVNWNNWGDLFFGKDLETEQGENHLGKILMKIRN